jgi:polyhydroxyalkanoate synthesis repressor PhaR
MYLIKRYPNRKLYNTEAKKYITLDGIADLIRAGNEVQVIDNATGEDLTALTLTQIILEQEKRQDGLLSNSALTNLIRSSGDRLSSFQRNLFSSSTSFFHQMDEEIRRRVQGLVHQGELTDIEGENLLNKLLRLSPKPEFQAKEELQIAEFLKKHEVPTRDDLLELSNQLEQLTAQLEELTQAKPAS